MKLFAVLSTLLVAASANQWTIYELSQAISSPYTNPYDLPYLEAALNELMLAAFSETPISAVSVASPTVELSYWTLNELSEALQDPTTSEDLLPYIQEAMNMIISNIFAGNQQESIIVATPIGVLSPVDSIEVSPVVPLPVEDVPETPLKPESASPLVQIIVNVNSQQDAVVAPSPVVVPTTPVAEPTVPVRPPGIAVNPIGVNPVNPIGVNPVSPPVFPGGIIAVNPVGVNPIDVILN